MRLLWNVFKEITSKKAMAIKGGKDSVLEAKIPINWAVF
jgi:hypothetical protein